MKKTLITLAVFAAVAASPAHAISAGYRAQLERSGCTQETDGNGCDIHKTAAQNGFSRADMAEKKKQHDANLKHSQEVMNAKPVAQGTSKVAAYYGTYGVWMEPDGNRVFEMKVMKDGSVTLNGKKIKEVFADGSGLNVFDGNVHIILKGDRNGTWKDSDAGTHGTVTPI